MSFLVLRDPVFYKHQANRVHPESPARLAAIDEYLDREPLPGVVFSPCTRAATDDELLLVHSRAHIDAVARTAEREYTLFDEDTYACADSHYAARIAAGTLLSAVDLAVSGKQNRIFAAVRPPGHHAEHDRAMGFCLFNNAAAGAAYALARRGLSRTAVFDFDLHHGNGTQQIFYGRSDVLYLSHHQFPFYPGTGDWSETGIGDGLGANINCPLPRGAGDAEILFLWDAVFKPVLSQYRPQILFLSAGYDAHADDPLGELEVSDQGYARLADRIEAFAVENGIPLIYTLEGGYSGRALAAGVKSALSAHLTPRKPEPAAKSGPPCLELLASARETFSPFWRL